MKIALLSALLITVAVGCNDPTKDKPKAVTGEAVPTAGAAAKPAANAVTYSFDNTNSKIGFVGSKVTGKHDGSFGAFKGTTKIATCKDAIDITRIINVSDSCFGKTVWQHLLITLIEGKGMVLTFNGTMRRRIDRPFAPLPFDGGWRTDCELIDGPLRDFNLMVLRRWGRASMAILKPREGEKCEIGAAPVVLLHVFAGAAALDHGSAHFDLAAGDTLHLERPAESRLTAASDATVAAIYLEPRS